MIAAVSGAAHAVIWLVWLRQLALVFDGRAWTLAVTAAAALVAAAAGHARAPRGRPLKVAAWCQLAVVIATVVVAPLLQPLRELWVAHAVAGGWSALSRALAQAVAVVLLLGVPAAASGAELAVLARLCGRASAWRALGAALGAGVFAFHGVRAQGLSGSAFLAAVVLAGCGLVVLGFDRFRSEQVDAGAAGAEGATSRPGEVAAGSAAVRLLAGAAAAAWLAASGAAVRAAVGGAFHALAMVLVAWLAGRAAGRACSRSFRATSNDTESPDGRLWPVLAGVAALGALAWLLPRAGEAARLVEALGGEWAAVAVVAGGFSLVAVAPVSALLASRAASPVETVGLAFGLVLAGAALWRAETGRPFDVRGGDLAARLHAHLPLLAHAAPRRVLALESVSAAGVTAALAHPVAQVMWAAPGVDDARLTHRPGSNRALAENAANGTFDVILAGPDAPWELGAVSALSAPGFAALRERLAEGGFVALRLHARALGAVGRDRAIKSFGAVFPFVTVFSAGPDSWIVLGAMKAFSLDHKAWLARVAARPGAREDLGRVGVHGPSLLFGHHLAAPEDVNFLFESPETAFQSDDRPRLELEVVPARGGEGPIARDDWEIRNRRGTTLLAAHLAGGPLPAEDAVAFVRHFQGERDAGELETVARSAAPQPDALLAAAALARAAGDRTAAFELAARAPAEPGAARAALALALELDEREKPMAAAPKMPRARAAAEALVKLAPADHAALGTLGWIQYRTGDLAAAKETLTRAIALVEPTPGQPEEVAYRAALGLTLIALKDFGGADRVLTPVDALLLGGLKRAPTVEQLQLVSRARRSLWATLWDVNKAR